MTRAKDEATSGSRRRGASDRPPRRWEQGLAKSDQPTDVTNSAYIQDHTAGNTSRCERPPAQTNRRLSVFESHYDPRVGKLDSPSCNTASHRLPMPTHSLEAQTNRPR